MFGVLLAFLSILYVGAVSVTLDTATVTGVTSESGSTNQFLGIPFAQPPTGDLRLQLPQPLPPYDTSFAATAYGPACPQQAFKFPVLSGPPADVLNDITNVFNNFVTPFAEDCLTLNVVTPASATPASKLPVVVWIYGGAFEFGGTNVYDGSVIVDKGIALDVPVVFVSMNYRQVLSLNAFGFLASRQVKDAGVGNLGLQDQRLALRWVQKYISAFGGDPNKVTIWGYSAGAMSVALQMVTNGGNPEGLFRAAWMGSGSLIPAGDITNGQPYYDALVAETGCSGVADTLQCLREVPHETLLDAMNQSPGEFAYQSLHGAWMPRVDGVFLTADSFSLVQQGVFADVPYIGGDCDDEGTLFSFANMNVTTDTEFGEYIKTYYYPDASTDTIERVMKYYPSDPTQGSPFDTGYLNALTPQFKRLAAFQGDYAFHGPRRFLLRNRSGKQNTWTYLSQRSKLVPFLGSYHTSDLGAIWNGLDMAGYLVRFVANLDPNVGESTDLYWPQYDAQQRTMLELLDGLALQALTTDTYRSEEIAYLTSVALVNPW